MTPRWKPPAVTRYQAGPWQGMRQHLATKTDSATYAELLLNGYIRDPDIAPVFVGRPGFTEVGGAGLAWAGVGGGGGGGGQLVYQFTRQDQVKFRLAIVAGKVYTYNPDTDTFTEVLTAGDLSGAAITLNAASTCYAVTFANTVIVSDGVNVPWSWNGTTHGGLTKLTACPVLFGRPWVRSGRLCGIVGTNTAARKSFVWSEVGDPTVGYGSGQFANNIWDVVQTSNAIFVAGAATNAEMIIARGNSVTRILGEIDTEWKTTSTLEGVHEFVGTVSPGGMVVHLDTTYFFANDGRIMRVRPGGVAEEIAVGGREFMARQSVVKFGLVHGLVWDAGSSGEYLLWIIAGESSSSPDTVLVVDPRSAELSGVWTGWTQGAWGTWEDASGSPVLVHVGGATADTATGGRVYLHGTPTGIVWDDRFSGGEQPITHTILTHSQGMDEIEEKYWGLIDVSIIPDTDLSGLALTVRTPYGYQPTQVAGPVPSSGARWDVGLFDDDGSVFGGPAEEHKVAVGLDTSGRWAQVELTHRTVRETFACQSVVLRGQRYSAEPTVP